MSSNSSFLNVSQNVLQDINQVLGSIYNISSQTNDVSFSGQDSLEQLKKLIPIAWVTVVLVFLRLVHLIILAYRKSPSRIINSYFSRNSQQSGNTDVN